MVRIHNTDLIKELVDVVRIQTGTEAPPIVLSNQVVPVIDVNPKHAENTNWVRTSSSTATGVLTVALPSGVDFYLTGLTLSFTKNATCDIATGKVAISGVLAGDLSTGRDLLSLAVLTLTAERDSISITFDRPILMEEGSNISVSGTFTAGAMSRCASIQGMVKYNPNA